MAIYDEAVVDAKKLREVAENAAKQQILEAITPRIREMINSRILHEQPEPGPGFDVEAAPDDTDDSDDDELFSDVSEPDEVPVSAVPETEEEPSKVVIHSTGDIHIESNKKKNEPILTDRMAESLKRIIKNEKKQRNLQERINNLDTNHQLFKEAVRRLVESGKVTPVQKAKIKDTYRKLAQEAISLRGEVVANGGGSQRLERKLVETLKEMKTMSSRTRRNIFDFLFESEDGSKQHKEGHREESAHKEADHHMEELDELYEMSELEEGDDDDSGEEAAPDMDVDAVKSAVEQLADALGMKVSSEEAGGDDADLDLDLGDEGDKKDEGDLEEGYHSMEETGYGGRGDHTGADVTDEGSVHEKVYEIDEAALRRELGKMKRLREARESNARKLRESRARRARMLREEAEDHVQADQFGGGEAEGDMFIDVDEDTLLNALSKELGSVHDVKESRLRKAMQEAAAYKNAAETLKGQLVEMNLFNAKLLYANKLMQNKDLTVKQQRAIVEALDNAKTLREAKLLYKSLSESLARRAQKTGALSENVNRTVLGSSSRSTRSAQPASSGVEVDRWAVLAGIPEGK